MKSPIWIQGRAWEANSYVVDNILIDAGVGPDAIDPYKEDISMVVLTHGHFDHLAHAKEICELCGAKLCIGEFDMAHLGDASLSLSAHFLKKQPELNAVPLHDGDKVGDFTVYHTPGHTHGSICLFREDDGVLISGDTIFPGGSYGRCDLPTGNEDELRMSINRIAGLSVESLWPGHDIPVPSGAMRHILLSQSEINR